MKYRLHFRLSKTALQCLRRFSDDPAKTFRQKGLSEENRYFLRKQQEELLKLRKELLLLAKFQAKLNTKLDQSQKAITDLIKKDDQKKE